MTTRSLPTDVTILSLLALLITATACADDQSVGTGRALYRQYCASCHGPAGLGDGPSARHFKADIPDLTRIGVRHGGRFPTRWVTRIIDGTSPRQPHGPQDMPAWAEELSVGGLSTPDSGVTGKERIRSLTDYLQSIQRP